MSSHDGFHIAGPLRGASYRWYPSQRVINSGIDVLFNDSQTSFYGNTIHITGLLWGESICNRWILGITGQWWLSIRKCHVKRAKGYQKGQKEPEWSVLPDFDPFCWFFFPRELLVRRRPQAKILSVTKRIYNMRQMINSLANDILTLIWFHVGYVRFNFYPKSKYHKEM